MYLDHGCYSSKTFLDVVCLSAYHTSLQDASEEMANHKAGLIWSIAHHVTTRGPINAHTTSRSI